MLEGLPVLGARSAGLDHRRRLRDVLAPEADRAAVAARRARPRRATGRKLIRHDRGLGVRWIAGADEAGRGCLAGPLVAAAVLLDMERIGPHEVRALSTLNDSKQLTPAEREKLYPVILRLAERSVIVSRCPEMLDARGLGPTNHDALRDALRSVSAGHPGEVLCLVDHFTLAPFEREQRAITHGDATSAAIAAASILAKVSRDRFMHRAEERHPGWEFSAHVGYSTPAHRAAIGRQGVSPLHRRSFASVAYTDSESPLEVLERLEPVPGADHDPDRVEP